MTLNEYVLNGIHELMTNTAELAANMTNDPDQAAAIPYAFFHAEEVLRQAWLSFVEAKASGE